MAEQWPHHTGTLTRRPYFANFVISYQQQRKGLTRCVLRDTDTHTDTVTLFLGSGYAMESEVLEIIGAPGRN
jgi:uncharacterized RDD family membrane protein YckC